jgi:hypothetical protein
MSVLPIKIKTANAILLKITINFNSDMKKPILKSIYNFKGPWIHSNDFEKE